MVKVPPGNALSLSPWDMCLGGAGQSPLAQTLLFPTSFTFSKESRSLWVPSQAVVLTGREALAALSAGFAVG